MENINRKISVAPLILVLLLMSAITLPTAAKESCRCILLKYQAKGSGSLNWGIAGIPGYVFFSEGSYYAVGDGSFVLIAEASVEEIECPFGPLPETAITYLLTKGLGLGYLESSWTNPDEKLCRIMLTLRSTKETAGFYTTGRENPGEYGYLLLGVKQKNVFPELKAPDFANPAYATMVCSGLYIENGVIKRINGLAHTLTWVIPPDMISEWPDGVISISVSLWINGKYLSIGWANQWFTGGPVPIPPADFINVQATIYD